MEQKYSYEFGIPSMSYFLLFSIFELKLMLLAWKARYTDIMYNNPDLFKKKLLRFYTIFYVLLFVGCLSINVVFIHYWSSLIIFASTWIFQIGHNAYNGTKPPYSFYYTLTVSAGKLFLPVT